MLKRGMTVWYWGCQAIGFEVMKLRTSTVGSKKKFILFTGFVESVPGTPDLETSPRNPFSSQSFFPQFFPNRNLPRKKNLSKLASPRSICIEVLRVALDGSFQTVGGAWGKAWVHEAFRQIRDPGGISWEVELCPSKWSNFKQPGRVLGGLGWWKFVSGKVWFRILSGNVSQPYKFTAGSFEHWLSCATLI